MQVASVGLTLRLVHREYKGIGLAKWTKPSFDRTEGDSFGEEDLVLYLDFWRIHAAVAIFVEEEDYLANLYVVRMISL